MTYSGVPMPVGLISPDYLLLILMSGLVGTITMHPTLWSWLPHLGKQYVDRHYWDSMLFEAKAEERPVIVHLSIPLALIKLHWSRGGRAKLNFILFYFILMAVCSLALDLNMSCWLWGQGKRKYPFGSRPPRVVILRRKFPSFLKMLLSFS